MKLNLPALICLSAFFQLVHAEEPRPVLLVTTNVLQASAKAYAKLHSEVAFHFLLARARESADEVQKDIAQEIQERREAAIVIYGDELQVPSPRWGATDSDAAYTMLSGDTIADLPAGRIPAANSKDAQLLNEKIAEALRRHPSALPKVLLVANVQAYPEMFTANQEAVRLEGGFAFSTQYGGAGATNHSVISEINRGYDVVAYRGHGLEQEWQQWDHTEQSLTITDLQGLTNEPAIFFNVACDNGAMIAPKRNFAEALLLLPPRNKRHRGASAVIASTRSGWDDVNDHFNLTLFRLWREKGAANLGELLMKARNRVATEDGSRNNQTLMSYLVLGDPLLPLP